MALCLLLVGAAAALIVLWPRPGTTGFTGVAVTVPACPGDVKGCRLFIARAPDASSAGHDDWSGASTTLNMPLPPGRYTISAEGCTGDQIGNRAISVMSGFHTAIDLGASWELPGFLGRACPGFSQSSATAG